jgi:hypothetical protein
MPFFKIHDTPVTTSNDLQDPLQNNIVALLIQSDQIFVT